LLVMGSHHACCLTLTIACRDGSVFTAGAQRCYLLAVMRDCSQPAGPAGAGGDAGSPAGGDAIRKPNRPNSQAALRSRRQTV
jgi:hypothetical protein